MGSRRAGARLQGHGRPRWARGAARRRAPPARGVHPAPGALAGTRSLGRRPPDPWSRPGHAHPATAAQARAESRSRAPRPCNYGRPGPAGPSPRPRNVPTGRSNPESRPGVSAFGRPLNTGSGNAIREGVGLLRTTFPIGLRPRPRLTAALTNKMWGWFRGLFVSEEGLMMGGTFPHAGFRGPEQRLEVTQRRGCGPTSLPPSRGN